MRRFVILFMMCCLAIRAAGAVGRVSCAVESRNVLLGEAFIFQIKVSDSDDVAQPAFPATPDFSVNAFAPSRNSSTQVSVINGKFNKTVTNELTFKFQLVPKRLGILTIPSVTLNVDGKPYTTEPIRIRVSKGETINDIFLELTFSDTVCYVGQPVMATWKLFIGRQTRNLQFTLPFLKMDGFSFLPFEETIDPNRQQDYRRITTADGDDIIGLLHNDTRDGVRMLCLEFRKPVVPEKAGVFDIPAGAALCTVEDRSGRSRRIDPFDFFNSASLRSVNIEGKPVKLTVRELPNAGKPADFSGIIGKCALEVAANPLDVNVGDPIIFTVKLTGLAFPEAARMPRLSQQKTLTELFRVSDEDTGKVEDGAKVYRCTIRALNADITEIPPVTLTYFDSTTGKYETIASNVIPVKVHAVKTVTASDAQGLPAVADTPAGREVEALDAGIAHNYAYDMMLRRDAAGFGTWSRRSPKLWLCLASVILYLLCALTACIIRHRNANPERLAARHAAARAKAVILGSHRMESTLLFSALQDYLRAKLHLTPGEVTFRDAAPALNAAGLDADTLKALESLFASCEAAKYAGVNAADDLQSEAARLLKILDRKL